MKDEKQTTTVNYLSNEILDYCMIEIQEMIRMNLDKMAENNKHHEVSFQLSAISSCHNKKNIFRRQSLVFSLNEDANSIYKEDIQIFFTEVILDS